MKTGHSLSRKTNPLRKARVVNGVLLAALMTTSAVLACESSLPLQGTLSIDSCDAKAPGCTPASKLVYQYTEAMPDDPKLFTIALQSSPWRFYDAQQRILTPEELATHIKSKLNPSEEKEVVLVGSWTGVAPDRGGKSLAQKVSTALGGFPVRGMDGFLWLSKDGTTHTTHQAFSAKAGGPYRVLDGEDVMVSLAEGWYAEFEDAMVKNNDAENLLHAGVGWDVYNLCPEHALQTFEAAARLSNPVAAYNAAMMRLQRNAEGDREAAKALLSQAAKAGDSKAQEKLRTLQAKAG